MRYLCKVWILAVVTPCLAQSTQSSAPGSIPDVSSEQAKWAINIAGVIEPPELTGAPKQFIKPTPTLREFGAIVTSISEKDREKSKAAEDKLSKFIEQHPAYSDALFLRATINLCILDNRDYPAILRDINASISTHQSDRNDNIYSDLTDHYSLSGKVKMLLGQRKEALSDLEAAMKINLSRADKIFNVSGTEPTRTSNACEWNLGDFDALISAFPNDYLPVLLRGLYFKSFTGFSAEGKYYPEAAQDFDKAATLKPKSPLPRYFLGTLYVRASIFTVAAASSQESQDAIRKKAIVAFTDAIHADAEFLPAYEERASQYLEVRDYQRAVADYDQVLRFDPENKTAYADRGLTELETQRYTAAIADFSNAIRRKKDDDASLEYSYEHRADAYAAIGDWPHAIADYGETIRLKFGRESFLMSLKQIRALYPEYDHVSDGVLLRKLRDLFLPQMDYQVFANAVMKNEGKWAIGDLHDLYQKRGDAYVRNNDFRRAARDFERIYKGLPDYAESIDKWRVYSNNREGAEQQIDVKRVRLSGILPAGLMLRTLAKDGTYVVRAYEFDCDKAKLNLSSNTIYGADDKAVKYSEAGSGWRTVTPGTQEQRLFNGMCSSQN